MTQQTQQEYKLFIGDNGEQDFYESKDSKRMILRNKREDVWIPFKTEEQGITISKTPLIIPDSVRQKKAKLGTHYFLGNRNLKTLLKEVKRETGETWILSPERRWVKVKGKKNMQLNDSKQIAIEQWKAKHPKSDYGICDTCNEGFDRWKYGDLESAGHEGHNVREPTNQEYEEAVRMCLEDGCDKEE